MAVLVCVGVLSISGHAQEPLRLNTAVDLALKNYPTLRERQAEVEVAREEIELTRTAYRPRVDLIGQLNRATVNNITGLVLPQSIVPTLSGRPSDSPSISTAWGSAAGVLLSWEPQGFCKVPISNVKQDQEPLWDGLRTNDELQRHCQSPRVESIRAPDC